HGYFKRIIHNRIQCSNLKDSWKDHSVLPSYDKNDYNDKTFWSASEPTRANKPETSHTNEFQEFFTKLWHLFLIILVLTICLACINARRWDCQPQANQSQTTQQRNSRPLPRRS